MTRASLKRSILEDRQYRIAAIPEVVKRVTRGNKKLNLKKKTRPLSVSKDELRQHILRVKGLAASWENRLRPWQHGGESVIRVASDCSGHGSDLIAYRLLGLVKKVLPVMMSETDADKVCLHEAVAKICGFNTSKLTMVIYVSTHVYVAGFPCPSFSNLGKRKGVVDRRGLCTLSGREYIARTRPKVIVLEQVASILHKTHAKVWGFVLKILAALKYKVVFKILNTKNLPCLRVDLASTC